MRFFLIIRPSLRNTSIPVFSYTFAQSELDARLKVEKKWGIVDEQTMIRELFGGDLNNLVISTNHFG